MSAAIARRLLVLCVCAAGMLLPAERVAADTVTVGVRSAELHVPPSYNGSVPVPLVVLLHGYTSTGALQESYMQFAPLADEFGFLYLTPDGTPDCLGGNQYWNATTACCDLCGSGVDDSGYLDALIDATAAGYNVDPDRIHLIGHSNGGFMSYRMACDHADKIAAIASLAGATWNDPQLCSATEPVHVLQIHGTADATILYGGGLIAGNPYPGAVATVEDWALRNGCALTPDLSPAALDLDASLAGDESTVARYSDGCAAGGSAELWTIVGGGHVPSLSPDFSREVVEYLLAHPKPATPALPVPLLAPSALAWLAVSLLGLALYARRRA